MDLSINMTQGSEDKEFLEKLMSYDLLDQNIISHRELPGSELNCRESCIKL